MTNSDLIDGLDVTAAEVECDQLGFVIGICNRSAACDSVDNFVGLSAAHGVLRGPALADI